MPAKSSYIREEICEWKMRIFCEWKMRIFREWITFESDVATWISFLCVPNQIVLVIYEARGQGQVWHMFLDFG